MSAECARVRISLGVYVLGAIEPAERAAVETHLAACRRCRDELAALAGLPALLGRVTEEQLAQVAAPPERLLEGLLARAAGESRRRRRRERARLAVAAAAAVVLAGAGLLAGTRLGAGREAPPVATTATPRPGTATPTAPGTPAPESTRPGTTVAGRDPVTGVSARITMQRRDWGTAFTVRLSGAPAGARCRLVAVGRDGSRDIAGGWQVEYEGYDDFHGSSMIPSDQIAWLEIRTVEGRRLLGLRA